jgi:hypothetical protein
MEGELLTELFNINKFMYSLKSENNSGDKVSTVLTGS